MPSQRNLSSTSVCPLDLACNLLRLKSFQSKRYLKSITLSPSWKTPVIMGRNIMLNSVGASSQPYLTPLVTKIGSNNSPSFWNRERIPSWNCRIIAMNLTGQSNFVVIFQSPSRLTESNALVRSTKFMLRSTFCSWHFFWSCIVVKIMSIVPLSFLKPHWFSGRSPDYSRCSFNLFSRTFSRIFQATDNKEISRWLSDLRIPITLE